MLNQLLRIDGPNALKRLFYGKRGEPYEIGGHVLRFIPGTRPTRTKYATSSNGVNRYDALQFLYMAEHLKPGMRCLDVGAHNGQDSLIMSALCGVDGHVTGFEPNAEAREILWQNVALNPGVKQPKIVSAAVSDNDGRALLYAEDGASSNSSLDPAGTTKDAVGQYEVDVVSLDRWITAMPDLVKIDIEGFEIRALAGATRLLASNAVILCELHPYAWEALGDSAAGLKALVAKYGRRIRYLDQTAEAGEIPHTVQGYGVTLLERV